MVYEYFSNKNFFKRHKYASPKASNIEYFWTLSPPNKRGLHVSLNYPYTDVKMVSPKNDFLMFLSVC